MDSTNAGTGGPAVPTLAVSGVLRRLDAVIAAWRAERRTEHELDRLGRTSPHLLRDIGIDAAGRWEGDVRRAAASASDWCRRN